jgi:hypothetical protein
MECTWAEATGTWIDAVNAENNSAGFAGHNDWRIPNIKELQSIVHYGRSGPAIDPLFSPTAPVTYWSSTPFFVDESRAWAVGFNNGNVNDPNKDALAHVLAVRGP